MRADEEGIRVDGQNGWILPQSREIDDLPDRISWEWLKDLRGLSDMDQEETEDLMSYFKVEIERFD